MTFANWSEALPYGLAIAKKLARRCPVEIDVESVVMEALWKAQHDGRVFSRTYVGIRVKGAIWDEMRSNAEGERGNYPGVGAFVDIDERLFHLQADTSDPIEAIDRERLLGAMPPAAVELVRRLANGESQEELALRYEVSGPRMSQVMADLKARPLRARQLPGHVDMKAELAKFARAELERRVGNLTGVCEIGLALGVSHETAKEWLHGSFPRIFSARLTTNPLRRAIRERALEIVGGAFRRSNGRFRPAAKLLGVCHATAFRWGKLLPPELMTNRSRRRPDLPDERFAELRAQGLSHRVIAQQLGVAPNTVYSRLRRQKTTPTQGNDPSP